MLPQPRYPRLALPERSDKALGPLCTCEHAQAWHCYAPWPLFAVTRTGLCTHPHCSCPSFTQKESQHGT